MRKTNWKKILAAPALLLLAVLAMRLQGCSTSGEMGGLDALRVILALGAVCAGAAILARKYGAGLSAKVSQARAINIKDRRSLDRHNSLVLVEARGSEFLLSCGQAGISLLAEICLTENRGFSELLDKPHPAEGKHEKT